MSRLTDRIDTTGLQALDGFAFPAFASPESLTHAAAVATRCQRALGWLADIFGERPAFTLIVAGPHDWQRVALISLYGMPHTFPGVIVTGTEPSGFWHDYAAALLPDLPPHERQRFTAVYGDPPALGERFAGLVVVHELAHLFHDYDEQTGLTDFPRLWLAELFANTALHGFVTENEPDQLPALQTICQLTWDAPAARWPVRDLNRMQAAFASGPLNYVWFQLRLLVIAKAIWQTDAAPALRAFRDTLTTRHLTDTQVLDAIHTIAPDAGTALRRWPV
jgi:hypothetical protein